MSPAWRLVIGMGMVAISLTVAIELVTHNASKVPNTPIPPHSSASIYIIQASHLPPDMNGRECYSLSYSIDGAAYYVNMETSKELWDFMGELKGIGALRGNVEKAYALTTR